MAIKRYDAESHVGVEYNGTSFSVAEMVESEEGGYVHYQDYQQLELKNTELMAQVDLANKKIKSCMGLRWSSDIKEKLKEITDATPTQCLNQIKAEAGRAGYIAGYEGGHMYRFANLADELADEYSESIAKGE